MPKPTPFSSHILRSNDDEPVLRGKPAQIEQEVTASSPKTSASVQGRAQTPAAIRNPEPMMESVAKQRPDYRKTRASKEGKKYINILIDEELQSEIRPRMMTRKLTWESLVEGLLQRWLSENPEFRP